MTNQTLADIQETDAGAGEDLQMMPEVYTHRRFLLQHIAAIDGDVKELAELMGLNGTLSDIIATVRNHLTEGQGTFAAAERELHSPFHQTAITEPAPASWDCFRNRTHALGEPCRCTDTKI